MPVAFISVACLFGLLAAYIEERNPLKGVGFMAAAASGGAIQIPGHDYTPTHGVTRTVASLGGACGVGCFCFTISALNSLVPSYMPSRMTDLLSQGQLRHFAMSMASLVLGLVAVHLIIAFALGAVLCQVESWDYGKAWKTIASVELGGGLPVPVGTPSTAAGSIIEVVVGCWAIGLVAIMVSVTASVSAGVIERCSLLNNERSSPIQALLTFGVTVVILIPSALIVAMALVGMVMACSTGLHFWPAFWMSLPCVSGGDAVVYPTPVEANNRQDVIMICCSTIGFLILSTGLNVCSDTLQPVVDALGFGKKQRRGVKRAVLALLLSFFVYIPLFSFIFSVAIGALLAFVEDWDFWWGFWWSVAAQLGGGMSLSAGSVSTTGGRVMGVLVAAWSMGVASLALGLTSAPIVNPLIKEIWQIEEAEFHLLTSKRSMRASAP